MKKSVIVMGVAGCGKSSLGAMLAEGMGVTLVEGDDYHSPTSREKMSQGIPLTDADREGWLETLGELLRQSTDGAVLTCSSLKKAYRDRLRAAAPMSARSRFRAPCPADAPSTRIWLNACARRPNGSAMSPTRLRARSHRGTARTLRS